MKRLFYSHEWRSFLFLFVLFFCGYTPLNAEPTVELEKGDHVTIVGNALPERMNHFGYFESLLHARFPEKNLVVRNIGYGGDVIDDDKNLRVQNYGSRDDWLARLDTDVIIAMYGFNESFRGQGEVNAFQNQVQDFVKHVTNKQYNGASSPRLALVSPIAFENINDPNLPNGTSQNRNLKAYTQAMQSVAKKHDIPFVNLFSATKDAYQSDNKHWTFNGVHLTEYGYKQLSGILDRGLFGERPSTSSASIKKMDLHENLEINLYASEAEFPELVNPLQLKYDTKGRLWTNTWEGYPNYRPPGENRMN